MNALVAALLAVTQAAADSTHFIVLNHGRPAGEMHVSATPDSVVVRFRYQDRQRGPRFETLYKLGPNRRVLALETRSVTPEGTLGPVTQRVDFWGDSLRSVVSGDTTLMRDDPTSYFVLDNIVRAAFDTAGRLFGISFSERPDCATYHPDVRAYEVRGATGDAIGLFLHDNFARPGKRSGAWMSSYREQQMLDGDELVLQALELPLGRPQDGEHLARGGGLVG